MAFIHHWKSWPPLIQVILLIPVPLLLGGGVPLGIVHHCSSRRAEGPEYVARVKEGTLQVQGGIDEILAAKVKAAILDAKEPITHIELNSGGGQDVARTKISAYLNELGPIPLKVPDKMVCISACVAILAYASGPVNISPSAKLTFHASATRFGLASSGFCGCLNQISVWWSSIITSQTERRLMLPWAITINEKLPSLFELCKKYPLDSDDGMTLTGADLDDLKTGKVEPEKLVTHCPPS